MAEPGGRGRSALRIPRVEFDLAGVILGAAASVAYAFAWPAMASVLAVDAGGLRVAGPAGLADASAGTALRSAFFGVVQRNLAVPGTDALCAVLGAPGPLLRAAPDQGADKFAPAWPDVPAWKLAAAAAMLLVLWSVIGGALARVHAVRKARDETVPFDQALAFSCGSIGQFVTAPLFTAAAGAMFVAAIVACGAASAIPWAGPVLQAALQPAAALCAVVAALLVLGLAFGFPLMQASVAVERSGSLDAVSRTFSYVWTRPVPFAVSSAIVVAASLLIERVAAFALGIFQALFTAGAGLVDASAVPRLADAFRASASLSTPDAAGAGMSQTASVWVAWAVAAVAIVLARGFVVSYLVGGFVDVYFALREDVDGVDGGEVFVEGAGETFCEGVRPDRGEGARPDAGGDAGPGAG